jgi:hypothetical protein
MARADPARTTTGHKHQINFSGGLYQFASVSNWPVLHCGFRCR